MRLSNRSHLNTLDLKEIKELIALMRKNDLSVFKMEKEGFKITLKKGTDFQPLITTAAPAPQAGAVPASGPVVTEIASTTAAPDESNLREITSPMVGTFYASPSPDAPPFVTIGQEVTEDTVVCIMEAMKVMNEIKAEVRGVIVDRVAESGKPVQYGQVLFKVR